MSVSLPDPTAALAAVLQNFTASFQNLLTNTAGPIIEMIGDEILQTVAPIFNSLQSTLVNTLQIIQQEVSSALSQIQALVQSIITTVVNALDFLKDQVIQLIEAAIEEVRDLGNSIVREIRLIEIGLVALILLFATAIAGIFYFTYQNNRTKQKEAETKEKQMDYLVARQAQAPPAY